MLLLQALPLQAIPPEGAVLVVVPVQPQAVRQDLRDGRCATAVGDEQLAASLSELLDTRVAARGAVEVPTLQPGHCHYLVSRGNLFHLSVRPS